MPSDWDKFEAEKTVDERLDEQLCQSELLLHYTVKAMLRCGSESTMLLVKQLYELGLV